MCLLSGNEHTAASSLVSLGRKKDTGSVYSSMQDLQDKQIFTEIGT